MFLAASVPVSCWVWQNIIHTRNLIYFDIISVEGQAKWNCERRTSLGLDTTMTASICDGHVNQFLVCHPKLILWESRSNFVDFGIIESESFDHIPGMTDCVTEI